MNELFAKSVNRNIYNYLQHKRTNGERGGELYKKERKRKEVNREEGKR
jgi:hypothetical protein